MNINKLDAKLMRILKDNYMSMEEVLSRFDNDTTITDRIATISDYLEYELSDSTELDEYGNSIHPRTGKFRLNSEGKILLENYQIKHRYDSFRFWMPAIISILALLFRSEVAKFFSAIWKLLTQK